MFPAETVAMKLWKRKTRYYHQKLKLRVVSRIAEQFKTHDLRKWGNIKAIYLSFNWLNDSWTRNSWIWTRNSWIWTRNLWIWIRTFEFHLAVLSFQLVTNNSELLTRKSRFTISQEKEVQRSLMLTLEQLKGGSSFRN